MAERRILISEPNAAGEAYAFLPYVWAILKSYWEHHGSDAGAYRWLDPIFRRSSVDADLRRLSETPPDVLGLSCYTWNWDIQCRIARWAKALNPDCLVVAGGPDPDYKDPDFFRTHPYIDLIVVKDGEIPFTRILETLLQGRRDFRHVPGLHLPRPAGSVRWPQDPGPHLFTGPAEVPSVFDYSPYIEQSDLYERIMASLGDGKMNATWETNRGCPYGCSFCDWGSATLSKVRRFEMSRVEAEADWLGRLGVHFVFLADANFGIFARDVDIAEHLGAARAKYGAPKFLYYSSAKNNPERTVEISKRTYSAGLTHFHVLSVQHTDPDVLAATARSNIPAEKYRETVEILSQLNIPSEVQLITGIPGDDPVRWRRCLGEIMEWGVHDNYSIFPYSLLPNAPAADPVYRDTWQIRTAERWLTSPGVRRERTSLSGFAKSQVVIATRTYTTDEWIEMNTYAAFIKAYHNRSLTRLPALYLRFAHGVRYEDFYHEVIDVFCRTDGFMRRMYDRVEQAYRDFVRDPDASDEIALAEFPDYPYYVDAARWLFVTTCRHLEEFYDRLERFLVERYPSAPNLADVIAYQKNLVVLPTYAPATGRQFQIAHDWPAFFRATARPATNETAAEPSPLHAPATVSIRQRYAGGDRMLDFGTGGEQQRWSRWIDQTVPFENASVWSNFSELQVEPAAS